jgi:F-type H+-transporting ATPase subunit gamma
MSEQFLPIQPVEEDVNTNLDYIFEPSKEEIVETLIPKSLKTQLFKGYKRLFCFRTRCPNDCNA